MDESERVFEIKKLKSRLHALIDEEPDIDRLHYFLIDLTDAKMAREAAG